MSVLARYKKPGGFRQLLRLIETSQPIKQNKLIDAIAKENPQWAEMVQAKKITVEMVLSWSDDNLVIIFENMNIKHCCLLMKSIDASYHKRFSTLFRAPKYREINEQIALIEEIKPHELMAAQFHMLETVRFLEDEHILYLSLIDPKLDLSDAA